jgi:hypothetical protein
MLCKCCRVSNTGDAAGDGDTVKTEAGKLGIETGPRPGFAKMDPHVIHQQDPEIVYQQKLESSGF